MSSMKKGYTRQDLAME